MGVAMAAAEEQMDHAVAGLRTKADKIRALAARGHARADIARFLGIRYQHVRNTLEADKLKAAKSDRTPPAGFAERAAPYAGDDGSVGEAADCESAFVPLHVAPDGRIVIPAGLRAAMMLGADGRVTASVRDGELRLISPMAAVRKAQKIARTLKRPGESVVDEFLAERRALWGEE